MKAYCLKCKAQREMNNPQTTDIKNNRASIKGACSHCGASMHRIGSIPETANA